MIDGEPTVSAIIPAYNAEKTIEKCINSVLNQTYQACEIVIVDDGSVDGTYKILRDYEQKHSIVKAYTQHNAGVSAARNAGIRYATGDFVVFVDADDEISPNMLEMLIKYQKEYDVDLVKSGLVQIYADGTQNVFTSNEKHLYNSKEEIRANFFELFSDGLNSPVGKLYKTRILQKEKIFFDEKLELSEDLIFNLSYLEKIDRVLCVPDACYQYYIYNSVATTKYREHLFEKRERAIILFEEFLKRNSLDCGMIANLYIKLVFAAAIQEIDHGTSKKDRLECIKENMMRQTVQNAIVTCVPKSVMEQVLYRLLRWQSAKVIDISARWMARAKKGGLRHMKRTSV